MQNAPHKCAATITENMDNVEIVDECGLTVAETSSLFYNFNQVELNYYLIIFFLISSSATISLSMYKRTLNV
jgi:hypothetical protein